MDREDQKTIEIVGERVLNESGCFRRIQRWIKGWHPELGTLIFGLTGPETLVETHSIRPMKVFTVSDGCDQITSGSCLDTRCCAGE